MSQAGPKASARNRSGLFQSDAWAAVRRRLTRSQERYSTLLKSTANSVDVCCCASPRAKRPLHPTDRRQRQLCSFSKLRLTPVEEGSRSLNLSGG